MKALHIFLKYFTGTGINSLYSDLLDMLCVFHILFVILGIFKYGFLNYVTILTSSQQVF
jgi:hypothetical protein